ncbi:hypothetical protein BP00DRAFT_269733 [Aspergillus indologenus CBS 114.80]|uniref:Uncharacterized protein n=1 Tax=Aspergillus indologenus CBS 114.80 TaxID=1450541 RepID=A0A2V5I1Z7_9EURO|nr:hypothetical protein BP00DRAFT_269733 [Aspergillus indologenus CBS 114.80]
MYASATALLYTFGVFFFFFFFFFHLRFLCLIRVGRTFGEGRMLRKRHAKRQIQGPHTHGRGAGVVLWSCLRMFVRSCVPDWTSVLPGRFLPMSYVCIHVWSLLYIMCYPSGALNCAVDRFRSCSRYCCISESRGM